MRDVDVAAKTTPRDTHVAAPTHGETAAMNAAYAALSGWRRATAFFHASSERLMLAASPTKQEKVVLVVVVVRERGVVVAVRAETVAKTLSPNEQTNAHLTP